MDWSEHMDVVGLRGDIFEEGSASIWDASVNTDVVDFDMRYE